MAQTVLNYLVEGAMEACPRHGIRCLGSYGATAARVPDCSSMLGFDTDGSAGLITLLVARARTNSSSDSRRCHGRP